MSPRKRRQYSVALMAMALLLATPAAVQWASHHRLQQFADSTVTILRAKGGAETVSVPSYTDPASKAKDDGAAKNASEFCPAPYRMTARDGCQPRGQQ